MECILCAPGFAMDPVTRVCTSVSAAGCDADRCAGCVDGKCIACPEGLLRRLISSQWQHLRQLYYNLSA